MLKKGLTAPLIILLQGKKNALFLEIKHDYFLGFLGLGLGLERVWQIQMGDQGKTNIKCLRKVLDHYKSPEQLQWALVD